MPTMAMLTSPSGLWRRSETSSQRRQVGLGRIGDAEGGEHFAVEAFLVIGERHVVDRGDVEALDHGAFAHVAEQRELLALARRDRPVAADQQHVGRDADGAQLLAPSAGSAWS